MNTLSAIANLSSLTSLKGLTDQQLNALYKLNITKISDLLNYRPMINAKMLIALAKGGIDLDLKSSKLVNNQFVDKNISEVKNLPISALVGIDDESEKRFNKHFGIKTIEELANFKPFIDAERIVLKFSNEFHEPASAPEELMPVALGNIQSSVNFSSFIKEKTLKFHGLELIYDDQKNYLDIRLAALFPVHGITPILNGFNRLYNIKHQKPPVPEIQLGYITKMSQTWINAGTHLGEIVHSLPLAPGESRNIAVIDWKRKQATQRTEETTGNEQLTNELFHKRALDEVTSSTANEHQYGGTDMAAGTLATAGAGVVGAALAGGVAGTLPGAAIGAIAGGVAGAIAIPGLGEIPGIPAGALAGAVVGFGVGAAASGGAALLGAANAQLGMVHSDSGGDRTIVGSLTQNISEITVQKASSVRSLWSTVIVTDEQAENERLSTRNITNYNHSHALTIQYYEVLQHYKSEISLTGAEPIIFLPFKPLDFTIDFIADYWDLLSRGVRNPKQRREFDAVINGFEQEQDLGDPKIEYINIRIVRLNAGGFYNSLGVNGLEINLSGISGNKPAINNSAIFNFDEPKDAELLKGVQVLKLIPSEQVKVFVQIGLVNNQNTKSIVTRESDRLLANSNGLLTYDFIIASGDGLTENEFQRKADEIERYFNSHRYFFTRLLLLSIEKEQMIDLIESLMLRTSIQIKLPGTTPSLSPLPGFPTHTFSSKNRTLSEALIETSRNLIQHELDKTITSNNTARLSKEERDKFVFDLINEINQSIESSNPIDPKDAIQQKKTLTAIETSIGNNITLIPGLNDKVKTDIKEKIKGIINVGFTEIGKMDFWNSIHLSEFIDTTPLGITGNTIIFKMRKVNEPLVLNNNLVLKHLQVKELKEYPEKISEFISKSITDTQERKKYARNADIYLPTSGVFAEAILGRSNSSEKIDITRFFNWQDSPIPHLAPTINPITAGGRQNEPLPADPNIPGSVLNIVNPAPFPDPTGLTSVLSAIQNGNIFRDMSKSDQLVTVMSNLSNLAQNMANQAGTLAGNAQSEALKAAVDIGKAVALLASQQANQPANLPTTPTNQGAAANILEQLKSSPNPIPSLDEDIKRVIGVPPKRINPPSTNQPALDEANPNIPEEPLPEGNPVEEVEIKLRIFSQKPAELIIPVGPLGGEAFMAVNGDNRDFSYDQGPSRLDLTVHLLIDVTAMQIVGQLKVNKGTPPLRALYDLGDFEKMPGAGSANVPVWAGKITQGKAPLRISQVFDDIATIKAEGFASPSRNDEVVVKLTVDANLFTPTISLPPFLPKVETIESIIDFINTKTNANINVIFTREIGDRLKAIVSGRHDGFPAYEIYVNRIQVYKFDAIAEGKDNRAMISPIGQSIEMNQSFLVPPLNK